LFAGRLAFPASNNEHCNLGCSVPKKNSRNGGLSTVFRRALSVCRPSAALLQSLVDSARSAGELAAEYPILSAVADEMWDTTNLNDPAHDSH